MFGAIFRGFLSTWVLRQRAKTVKLKAVAILGTTWMAKAVRVITAKWCGQASFGRILMPNSSSKRTGGKAPLAA